MRVRGRRYGVAVLALVLAVLSVLALCANAQESAKTQSNCGSDDGECRADAQQVVAVKATAPEFVATDEWQEVLPGQSVPPGLHIRLNFQTGKREAKLLSEDDNDQVADPNVITREVVVNSDASVTVETDITGEVNAAGVTTNPSSHAVVSVETEDKDAEDITVTEEIKSAPESKGAEPAQEGETPPAAEPNWNHEKIYEVLQALPEPPLVDGMDINEAHAKLSTPEFRRRIIKLWKKRQQELKDAIESMQDDAKYLAKILEQFQEAEKAGNTEEQLRVLEVLEWEVQDLDKTHVFNFIGGFNIITEYLNSTNLPVRAHAAWLVGTAVKNYKDGQDWAINAGAIPKLVNSLSLSVPSDDSTKSDEVYEVKKKALYALSSLVRFNERGQRLLLSLQGPDKLAQLFDNNHPRGVQLKAVLFVHDLLFEEPSASHTEGDEAALPQLHAIFRSSAWCNHVAEFLNTHGSRLQRHQAAEVMDAMKEQLPACSTEFAAKNVKSTIEKIKSTWSQDSSLEDDERRELQVPVDAVLARL
ncbi:hypothetical protein Poli38472_002292 [Pythium oligandrum]|uniref:Nucleotide exchange factor SIL1 n=1 Tax=Pythium oligandrum TaxID=41045 RepID=A0A8K1CGY8_PYTOL|nr:hypothetical protein Poli38472_002292 [Pythium oligandrum]|eukprot:TMW63351.1 hypothetical protein Poli38472_002292 [Pythium oligandrum]